jgi:hypothetical protein
VYYILAVVSLFEIFIYRAIMNALVAHLLLRRRHRRITRV